MKTQLLILFLAPMILYAQDCDSLRRLDSLIRNKNYKQALHEVDVGLTFHGDSVAYHLRKAQTLVLSGEREAGLKWAQATEKLLTSEGDRVKLFAIEGKAYMELGEILKADSVMKMAEEVWQQGSQHDPQTLIYWCNYYGELLWEMGRPFETMSTLKRGIAVMSDSLRNDYPNFFNNLGIINWEMGQYNEAVDALKEAEVLYKRKYGSWDDNVGLVTNNIGVVYYHMGDLKRAEEYYKLANHIYEEGGQHDPKAGIRYHNNIARIEMDNKRGALALAHLDSSLLLLEGMSDHSFRRFLEIKQLRAEVFLTMSRPEQAVDMLQSVIENRDLSLPEYGSIVSELYADFGRAYLELGEMEKAGEFLLLAIESFKKSHHDKHSNLVSLHTTLSTVYLKSGRKVEALEEGRRALDSGTMSDEKEMFFSYPELLGAFIQLAKCQLSTSDSSGAKHTYTMGLRMLDVLKKGVNYRASRVFLAEKAHILFEDAISCGMTLNDHGLVFECIEKSKAFTVRMKSSMRDLAGENQDLLSCINREENLRSQRNFLELQLVGKGEEDRNMLADKLQRINRRIDSVGAVIEREFTAFSILRNGAVDHSLSDFQSNLGNSCYITYYFNGAHYLSMCVTRDRSEILLHEAFPEEVIKKYRQSLENINWIVNFPQEADAAFFENSQLLSRCLLEPYALYIEDADLLCINPSGRLNLINFDLLSWGTVTSEVGDYLHFPYLFKRCETVLALSSFSEGGNKERAGNFSIWLNDEDGELLFGRKEAERLEKITQGDLHGGRNCSESRFKEMARDAFVLHLIAHAKTTDEEYYLQLLEDASDDGKLYSSEIALMELRGSLVTLSACESGLGSIDEGESVRSLANAFAIAGVPAVLMSQWSVSDQSTSDLMVDFYGGLFDGKSKPEAWKDARLKYLKSQDNPVLRHPHFWGSFVVTGDASPLVEPSGLRGLMWGAVVGAVLLLLLRLFRRKRVQ